MNALKIMALIAAVLLVAITSQNVSANAYTGYNTIGDVTQYHVAYQGTYRTAYSYSTGPVFGGSLTLPNPYYAYPTNPRLGGDFGSWYVTGLRTPISYCVTPTHYATGYRQGCGSYGGNYGGGNYGGFSAATAPVRVRYSGGLI